MHGHFLALAFVLALSFPLLPASSAKAQEQGASDVTASAVDRSGREQRGQASVIARQFAGRRMADGGRFDPESDYVASNTLPLGTTARVTNLRNGKVTMVRVRDRMADRQNRILNVSPKVAAMLGMRENGVARIAIAPLAVPQRDGSVKLGVGTGYAGEKAYVTDPDRR